MSLSPVLSDLSLLCKCHVTLCILKPQPKMHRVIVELQPKLLCIALVTWLAFELLDSMVDVQQVPSHYNILQKLLATLGTRVLF